MILSVSRRSDIPAYYSSWFFNRLADGYVLAKNPYRPRQVSRISLYPDAIDFIVFWSKNPSPMISKLHLIHKIPYYFHFTLNAYPHTLEPHGFSLASRIDTFKRLSSRIGPERIIWRYDPILITDTFLADDHRRAFETISKRLEGYVTHGVISLFDRYKKLEKQAAALKISRPSDKCADALLSDIALIAESRKIKLSTCAETMDLSHLGIFPGRCIDDQRIARLTGEKISAKKDPSQRRACGCIQSVDIGAYDSCLAGCRYCYASFGHKGRLVDHDPTSPLLIGRPHPDDCITDRSATRGGVNKT